MRLRFAHRLLPAILATLSYPGLSLATSPPKSATEHMDRKLVAEPNPQEIYLSVTPVTQLTKAGTWNHDDIQGSLDQWTYANTLPTVSGAYSNTIDIGDIDGDGLWDTCVVQQRRIQPKVIYGDGREELLTGAIFGLDKYYNDCVIGDVNGDGQLDIILAGSQYIPLLVCFNNGEGFDTCQNVSPGSLNMARPYCVKIADVNNDNMPDIVVASYSGIAADGIYVWMNQGAVGENSASAAFPQGSRLDLPYQTDLISSVDVNSIGVADLNNDGFKDIVVTVIIQSVGARKCLVYLNNGLWSEGQTGGFLEPQKLSHPSTYNIYSQAIADFNGDNNPDIVLGVSHKSYSRNNWILMNQGGDSIWWDVAAAFPDYADVSPNDMGDSTIAIVPVDIDGDGDIDMVTGSQTANQLYVMINTGSGAANGAGLFDPTYYRLGRNAYVHGNPSKVIVVGSTTPGSPPPPTPVPTQAPTAAGPWSLNYDDVEANFTSGASNELEVGFFVGNGREVRVEVFETCDEGADEVPSTLYNRIGQEMVSHVPGEANATHSKIILGYNFDKAQMIASSLWNATSELLTFCQVTSLTNPDPNDGPDWVIASDRRVIEIQFDLDANFEVDVDLADRTIFNETKTISYDNDVEAYKCRGGDGNSFVPEGGALAPNVELSICIRIKNNTSVNIDQLALMTIAQDGKDDFIVARSGSPVMSTLTKMPPVSGGVIVKTRIPMGDSGFVFENGLSLNISGTVDLELATSRKLRALVGENDAAGEGREEAGYDVTVNLQSTADGFGPIGSSDGHAIVGKGLAALSLIVAAAMGLMM